jgi:uncharacterized membrane protein
VKLTDLHGWLLFLHIVMAMVWIGGAAVLCASAALVLRHADPGAVTRFVASIRTIGPVLLAPAPAIVLGTGVWMVVDDDAGWGQGWILAGLGLFAAAFLIGAAHNSRAAIAAERAAASGDQTAAARWLRAWLRGLIVICILLVAATWDMVFMPGT